eukprot:6179935-Pleurochrysis_carterae.AAC.1
MVSYSHGEASMYQSQGSVCTKAKAGYVPKPKWVIIRGTTARRVPDGTKPWFRRRDLRFTWRVSSDLVHIMWANLAASRRVGCGLCGSTKWSTAGMTPRRHAVSHTTELHANGRTRAR